MKQTKGGSEATKQGPDINKFNKMNLIKCLGTSAVSSTKFVSMLIFASCVVGICNILDYMWLSFFLTGGVLLFCLNIYCKNKNTLQL